MKSFCFSKLKFVIITGGLLFFSFFLWPDYALGIEKSENEVAKQAAAVSLVVTADPSVVSAAGTDILYTYIVSNDGDETLRNITVNDDVFGNIALESDTLEPQKSTSGTVVYPVSQDDIDAGEDLVNTAIVSAGEGITDEKTVTVEIVSNPLLEISKTTLTESYEAVGDLIEYQIVVRNAGNTTLENVSVTDPLVELDVTIISLAPKAEETYNEIYSIVQDDLSAGTVTNTATASGGGAPTVFAEETVSIAPKSELSITKTANTNSYIEVGDIIIYTIVVENTGNTTIASFDVSDPLTGLDENVTNFAPEATRSFTPSYSIEQADLDAGSLTNTATASDGGALNVSDEVTITAIQQPGLSITKTATEDSYSKVGDVINYTIVVKNTGNTTIASFDVSDPLTGLDENVTNFAPEATQDFTGSYTIKQSDLNAGSVTNVATASDGGDLNVSDDVTVLALQQPDLSISKTANETSYSETGDILTYTIEVENTGNTTIGSVTINDPLTGMEETLTDFIPGDSQSFTTTYTIQQTDLDAGSVTNTVTASDGGDVNVSASETVSASLSPQISITKTASPSTYNSIGDIISYTIEVVNTGNVVLSNVNVSDQLLGIEDAVGNLDAGASYTTEGSYTIAQIDLNNGTLSNTAFVSGNAPNNDVISDSDQVSVTANQNPAISANITSSPGSYDTVGDEITYNITVENSGNVILTGVVVSDPLTGLDESISILAPGESESFTPSYAVSQSDLNSGSVSNTVSVSGTGPDNSVVSDTDNVTVIAVPDRDIYVIKTASQATYKAVGDVINYSIFVENTGNVSLSGVTVSDPLIQLNASIGTLDPGETRSFSSTYTITQADLNNGIIINTVAVSGSHGNETISALAEAVVTALFPPAANNDINSDNISGNSVVTDILENDLLNDGSPALPGLVTVDLNQQAGGVQSQLNVTGEGTWNYNSQTGELTFTPQSGFTTDPTSISYLLTENSTGLSDAASVIVEYNEGEPFAFNDISTGNIPGEMVTINVISNDKLSDGSSATIQLVTIDININQADVQTEYTVPGEGSWVLDPETGKVDFTPLPGYSTDPTPLIYSLTENLTGLNDNGTVVIGYDEQAPVAADDVSSENVPGDEVTINILDNDELGDGTQALPELVSIDINLGRAGIQDEIEFPGEGIWSLDASTGIVVFAPQTGFTGIPEPLSYRITEVLTGLGDSATITITFNEEAPVALDDSSSNNQPGTEVSINILENDVLGDGSPALPDLVSIDFDPQAEGLQHEVFIEGQGTWTYNAVTGTVVFTPESGFLSDPSALTYTLCSIWNSQLCSQAEIVVDFEQDPSQASIGLIKKGTYISGDEVINYSFEVINTGSLSVWNVTVSDERIGLNNIQIVPDTLQPGASGTVTVTYQVTVSDKTAGSVENSALAAGFISDDERIEDISGSTVDDDEPTVTSLLQNASIDIKKLALIDLMEAAVNELIDFELTVKNNGDVVLENVRIEDPLTGFEQNVGELLPNDSVVYFTTYTVQSEDELNGEFTNTALATATAPDGSLLIDSSTVIVDVVQCELVIPTGFSPNDDGIQDVWRIKCLENYPDARVEVFNRWGNRVFEKENFGNSDVHGIADAWWDGYSTSKRTFGSGKLPAGTYYFILYLRNGQEPLNGYVFLNR